MASIVKKRFEAPDETRSMPNGEVNFVKLNDVEVMKATFQPGWRWSEHLKPIVGTGSCQVAHLLYVVSGRMGISMDDGEESEIGPGDVATVAPGHDAWIIGDEPCVVLDFQGASNYALPHKH